MIPVMRADYHMHSFFSEDSETSPRDMIEASIEKGLRTICLTDHMDKDVIMDGVEWVFDPEAYFSVLKQLKEEYQDQIEVLIGVEFGLSPALGDYFNQLGNAYPFDYIIGSQHMVDGKDPYYPEVFEGKTDEEVYRRFLENTRDSIQATSNFDVLGHLDYVIRYGAHREQEFSCERYADLIDEILKSLIENGKGLELNTAGLKYGLPFAHPQPKILKRYRELGGEILTIGADGHKPEHIAYDFSKVPDILDACGFAYYTEFRQRKPEFVQLSQFNLKK